MGMIKQAVPGGFNGKVGTVIGSSWKGIAVMRGLTIAKKGKPTPTEMTWKVYMDTGQRPEIPGTRWMR